MQQGQSKTGPINSFHALNNIEEEEIVGREEDLDRVDDTLEQFAKVDSNMERPGSEGSFHTRRDWAADEEFEEGVASLFPQNRVLSLNSEPLSGNS